MVKESRFEYKQYSEYVVHLLDPTEQDKNMIDQCKEITFQITNQCNLCCDYCYEHHKSIEVMSLDTAKKIIDMLLDGYINNTGYLGRDTISVILDFIGGEPLLHPKLIEDICDYWFARLARMDIPLGPWTRISISTNGQNWFDKDVQHLIKKYINFISLTVSIDGIKELHDAHRISPSGKGSFDNAFNAFKDLRDNYNSINSKMTFVPESFPYLFESIKFMIENGCDIIYCNCAYEPEYTEKDAALLYSELKKVSDYILSLDHRIYVSILDQDGTKSTSTRNYCGGGQGSMIAFSPDGKAYPCIRYCPISIGNKADNVCLGDTNGLYTTPKEREVLQVLKGNTYQNQSPQKCLDCEVSSNCGWCSAHCYETTGRLDKRLTNICWAHKASVLASYYFHNKGSKSKEWLNPLKMHITEDDALKIVSKDEWERLKKLEDSIFKSTE